MTFTDIAELKLRVLGTDAVKTFETLNASAKDVKDQLKEMELAGKKNTEEYRALGRVQRDIQEEIKKTTQGIDIQNATMKELEALMKRKTLELKKLTVGSDEWFSKLKEIEPIRGKMNEFNNALKGIDGTTKAQEGTWAKFGGWVKGAFVVGVVIEFVKQLWAAGMEVFNLTARFEKYEVVLKNALGSQEKATSALKMLKDIAATTPFSLDEMTASFNKMVQRGLLPTSGEMKKLADLAASQGKSFDQLTEAVLDAQMGEAERLKEFGIKMKKSGDDVSLSFKGQTTTVKNSEQAIYDAIVAMGSYQGAAGVTGEVSDKLAGKQSNLGDKIDFIVVKLGDKLKPVFHFILDLFVKGTEIVSDFIDKSAPLGFLIDAISETFSGLWNIGKEIFYKLFPSAQGQVFDMGKAVKVLGTVLYAILVPFQLLRATIVGLIDTFRVMGDATSMVWKGLKGDFEGAKQDANKLETSWNALKKNGTENFGAISKGFNKIWTDSSSDIKKTGKDWDTYVSELKTGQTNITKTTEGETKKREKLKEDELKRDEERFDELFDAQKAQVDRIKKLEEEYMKWLEEFRKYRNTQINDAIDLIEKSLKKKEEQDNKAHEEVIAKGKKTLSDRIIKTHQDTIKTQEAANDEYVKTYKDSLEYQSQALNRWYGNLSNVQKQMLDTGLGLVGDFLNKQVGVIEGKINQTSDLYEKARLETQKRWLTVGQDALGTLDQMLNGNIVGSVVGAFKTLAGALDTWLMSNAKEERARLEEELKLLKKAGEDFMKLTSGFITEDDMQKLNQIYESLIKISEIPPVRLDLGENDSYERRLQQELEIGASIVKNFEVAMTKEDELFDKSIANQEKIHSDALKKINEQYEASVNWINIKYDWEQQMANRIFDSQSLGIQNQTNAELMALVTNNETKLGLTTDYEAKKAFIMNTFADQIKPITADMSQAEIDGINRATEARDAQLAKLSTWLSGELTFVINNEGQKRKEYSATELIISNGQTALADLAVKHAAEDLARSTQKNIELAAAEAKKKTDTEAAETAHLATMEGINKAYTDKVTQLGLDKDAALAESFRILNDIVNKGYDDIIAKAQQAYNEGKLTADQYNEIANRLFTIKDMLGQIDWSKLTVPNIDLTFPTFPKFASGTEYVDAANRYPQGTDTVPAYLNKGERVISAPDNAQLRGISNKDIVGMVMRSNLYRNGPHISTSAGSMVNLANPASVHHATNITQQFSTTALEGGMGALAKELQTQSKLLEIIASKDPSINFHALKQAFQDDADISARASF